MDIAALILILTLVPCGAVAVITAIGWWATASSRMQHVERMGRLEIDQKIAAVTIRDRDARAIRELL